MKGLISIVVPVRNRAHCVTRTLDSIVVSTYRPIEVIVVDNGSTDDSLDVCNQWAERQAGEHLNVVVLQELMSGGNAARNRGLAEVRGEYVAFFDSDDLFSCEALEDIAQAVGQEETDVLFLPVEQEVDGVVNVRAYEKSTAPKTQIMNGMWSTASMVFRTQWLRNLGGWDERLSVWQDWELGLRVLLHQPRVVWLTSRPYRQRRQFQRDAGGHFADNEDCGRRSEDGGIADSAGAGTMSASAVFQGKNHGRTAT